jgi:hypothetical protein
VYGDGVQVATIRRYMRGPFDGLAAGSGFSVKDCVIADETGRLGGIVQVYLRRRAARAASSPHGTLPGCVALARIRARAAGL